MRLLFMVVYVISAIQSFASNEVSEIVRSLPHIDDIYSVAKTYPDDALTSAIVHELHNNEEFQIPIVRHRAYRILEIIGAQKYENGFNELLNGLEYNESVISSLTALRNIAPQKMKIAEAKIGMLVDEKYVNSKYESDKRRKPEGIIVMAINALAEYDDTSSTITAEISHILPHY